MADNKEIIFVLTRTNSIKDGIRTETHKDNAITRQEAIEVMAKAIYVHFVENSVAIGLATDWENLKQPMVKDFYIETAEAALNALLEGGK